MLRLKIYSKIYLKLLENNQNFPKNLILSQKKIKPKLPSLILNKDNTSEDELVLQAQNGLENRLENFIF